MSQIAKECLKIYEKLIDEGDYGSYKVNKNVYC